MRVAGLIDRLAIALTVFVALLATPPAAAQDPDQALFVDVRQGTDLSLTTRPGLDFIVIELLGRLWRLPISGGAAQPLTLADVEVRHPRVSRDGEQVIYQRLVDESWDIWTLNIATGRQTPITTDSANEREPDFLPGNGGIVFASDRSGQYDLWSVDQHGAQWQPVSTEPGDARFPNVADNGAIAYVVAGNDTHSLRIRAAGLTQTVYESRNSLGAPNWRPGGGVIIFSERGSDSDTRLQLALLAPELLVRAVSTGEDLFTSRLAWLDATRFLYAADGQIWRRELAGRARQPVHLFATAMISRAAPATHLPDETAAVVQITPGNSTRDGAIAVFASAGDIWLSRDNQPEQLTSDPWWNENPIIDAAGRFVIFARNHGGERRLWRIPVATGQTPEVLTPSDVRAFAPALDSTGSRLAYLTSTGFSATEPARLNTLYFDDGTQQRSRATMQALTPPRWLADNRVANITVDSAQPDGSRRTIAFDASLRTLTVEVAEQALTAPDQTSVSLPAPVDVMAERADDSRYVIQAGRLFDGIRTEYRRHVDIHIEAGRIVDVVARGRAPLPETVIDATGLTILPGLIDIHTHDQGLLGELAGRAWLAFGVTTVRSVGRPGGSQPSLAAAWNSGHLPGPRFIQARPGATTAVAPEIFQPPALIDDPFVTLPGEPPAIIAGNSLLPALRSNGPANRVRPVRRYSPGHAHYQDIFALVAASGATEITSLGAFAPAALAQLLDSAPAAQRDYEQLFNARDRAAWHGARPLVDGVAARQQSLTRLLRAGGRIAVGSESPLTPPGVGAHIELALFAAAGVPVDQVLRSATSHAALALGLEAEIGSVESGRRADLLVVEGDPLTDLSALLAIRAVVRDGHWIERNTLLTVPSTD